MKAQESLKNYRRIESKHNAKMAQLVDDLIDDWKLQEVLNKTGLAWADIANVIFDAYVAGYEQATEDMVETLSN